MTHKETVYNLSVEHEQANRLRTIMAACYDVRQFLEGVFNASEVATAEALNKKDMRLLRVPDCASDALLDELCEVGAKNAQLLMLFHRIVVSNVLLSVAATLEQQATLDGRDGTLQYAAGGRRIGLELLHDELCNSLLGDPPHSG